MLDAMPIGCASCGIRGELPKSQNEHTWTLWKQSPKAKLLNEHEGHT